MFDERTLIVKANADLSAGRPSRRGAVRGQALTLEDCAGDVWSGDLEPAHAIKRTLRHHPT
jgi:hypothetical protein